LDRRSFTWYHEGIKDWYGATGDYVIMIGNSSRNIVAQEVIHYISETKLPFVVTKDTTIGELLEHEELREYTHKNLTQRMGVLVADEQDMEENQAAAEAISQDMQEAMVRYMPIRSLRSFDDYPNERMLKAVAELNDLLKNSK
ncbi:MAG: hypothetical protein GX567_08390, partial [Clostridia bacterium]|nr:hypothetical protein [Clostridia bacterium]